jgi:hypothetical protein
MVAAGDRFKGWVENTASSWSEGVGGWFTGLLVKALALALNPVFNAMREYGHGALGQLRDDPSTPPEVRDFLSTYVIPVGSGGEMLGSIFTFMGALAALMQLGGPAGRMYQYVEEKLIHSFRLDPSSVITAWRRDQAAYEHLFDDLKDQGWDADRIEALKFVTQFYPGPSDLVRFQAREVFEPDMISRYGLDDEFGGIDLEPFRKAGMTDEITLYYWRAHWEHASWNQVVEMLHRGQLTEDQVYDWFRLVEIPPFWRDKMIATSWNVPTRVDVRRFYDLKTIDEARLREIYTAMGYHDKDLDDYVLWTKIYVELPDLIARWKNGWITLDNARQRLVELGMTEASAEELIQTKVKVEEPEAVTEAKNLTKTEIYKGVKQDVITVDEGVELLMDLDYSRDQAEYLLAINVEALAGSPETFEQFKSLTDKYRRSTKMEPVPVPEELKAAADELVKIKLEVESLERSVKEEGAQLVDIETAPDAATAKLKQLQVALNRARAELQRVQLKYNSLVAQWKHGAA